MSDPMRKRHTSDHMIDCFTKQGWVFRIPAHIANKYLITKKMRNHSEFESINATVLFQDMDKKHTEAGALLRGTRHREGLSQNAFAKRIGVTQSDLSKMENGKRPIGKIVAKRIEKVFAVDYRYFLG